MHTLGSALLFKSIAMRMIITVALVALLSVACEKDPAPPGVTAAGLTTSTTVSAITYTGATVSGQVTSSGNGVILSRGVCWSVTTMPTTANSIGDSLGGPGLFSYTISGLNAGTVYYARCYVTNAWGTVYSNQVGFTTLQLPAVSTTSVTSITSSTASCAGYVSSAGSSTVTSRGFCWSTAQNPTISLSTKVLVGAGAGSFSTGITGLVSKTTYYVRAFATNAGGTSYGGNISFTTL